VQVELLADPEITFQPANDVPDPGTAVKEYCSPELTPIVKLPTGGQVIGGTLPINVALTLTDPDAVPVARQLKFRVNAIPSVAGKSKINKKRPNFIFPPLA